VILVVQGVVVLLVPIGPTTELLDVKGEYGNGGAVPVPTGPTDTEPLVIGYGTPVPLMVGTVAFTVTGKLALAVVLTPPVTGAECVWITEVPFSVHVVYGCQHTFLPSKRCLRTV
jgi:hypothetical protein